MEISANEIEINGQKYVKKGTQSQATSPEGLPYVIIRSEGAGVFAGYLKEQNGQEVVILESRRLWYWSGAASLSQLAIDGTSKPKDCKFPEAVSSQKIFKVLEIINVTQKAKDSIASVKPWQL